MHVQETIYPLTIILESIFKSKNTQVKKRLIYDQSELGGIGSKWIIAFFISLPLIEYAGIFNPYMFNLLGIAQAIIFFVVFLSMVMILIIGLAFINNTKVIRQITPSWEQYFPNVDLKLVLSGNNSPYKDFVKYYRQALSDGLDSSALQERLINDFTKMEEENSTLIEAINRNKVLSKEGK